MAQAKHEKTIDAMNRSGACRAVTPLAAIGLMSILCGTALANERVVEVEGIEQLVQYTAKDGYTVRMKPGVYRLIDHIPLESIADRRAAQDWHFLNFSGSNNVFDFEGVTIEVDTRLRAALRAPTHNPEFVVSGNGNRLRGLKITNIGDGDSSGGCVLAVWGDDNRLHGLALHVRGSRPYGYGDLFGKGGRTTIGQPLRKHSGLQIVGDNTRLIGCRIDMKSFGHGFYVQGATNTYLEDCCVEGEMRSTDDILAERSGPAYEADFRSVYRNRQGENRIAPGYIKSLAEDAFRTYDGTQGVTFINCTAKNMRAGFELRGSAPIRIENCQAIGNERGFWVGSEAVIENSRGDARYGPLLFVEGRDTSIELELMPATSGMNVHALATIHGSGHRITIRPWQDTQRERPVPIKLGYAQPGAGEGMSPYGERHAQGITLKNLTSMPLIISPEARDCDVTTTGKVAENAGRDISIH